MGKIQPSGIAVLLGDVFVKNSLAENQFGELVQPRRWLLAAGAKDAADQQIDRPRFDA